MKTCSKCGKPIFNNEYWTNYSAYKRQNTKGQLRGFAYGATGGTIGSILGPAGTVIGGIGGYIYGRFSVAKERIENNGSCPSWGEVGEEAVKTGTSVARKAAYRL